MGRWQYHKFPRRAKRATISAFGVRDVRGVHVGHLSGWISDDDGLPLFLEIRKSGFFLRGRYLISAGCVSDFNFRQNVVQLRRLRSTDLRREGLKVRGKLPPKTVLQEYLRNFPDLPKELKFTLGGLLGECNRGEPVPIWGSESSDGYSGNSLPYLAERSNLPTWKPLEALVDN